jgi:hypothetical protein
MASGCGAEFRSRYQLPAVMTTVKIPVVTLKTWNQDASLDAVSSLNWCTDCAWTRSEMPVSGTSITG